MSFIAQGRVSPAVGLHVPIPVQVWAIAAALMLGACASTTPRDAEPDRVNSRGVARLPPVVKGLDHFFATSPEPERLYRVFRDRFEFPEVYPFRNYGSFTSGVVSMGNVLFEVVTWDVPAGERLPTELKGLAFEPAASLDETMARMRANGVTYGTPDRVMMPDKSGTQVLAHINTPLDGPGGLPPADAAIFINDNLGSAPAVVRRRQGAEELERRRGGPLGVLSVQELVVGVEDPRAALVSWRKLLGDSHAASDGVIRWQVGPDMRFVRAARAAVLEVIVKVRSLERARHFLQTNGMLTETDGAMFITPAAVDGLRVRIVQ